MNNAAVSLGIHISLHNSDFQAFVHIPKGMKSSTSLCKVQAVYLMAAGKQKEREGVAREWPNIPFKYTPKDITSINSVSLSKGSITSQRVTQTGL
jgi:hypothetical protein